MKLRDRWEFLAMMKGGASVVATLTANAVTDAVKDFTISQLAKVLNFIF